MGAKQKLLMQALKNKRKTFLFMLVLVLVAQVSEQDVLIKCLFT